MRPSHRECCLALKTGSLGNSWLSSVQRRQLHTRSFWYLIYVDQCLVPLTTGNGALAARCLGLASKHKGGIMVNQSKVKNKTWMMTRQRCFVLKLIQLNWRGKQKITRTSKSPLCVCVCQRNVKGVSTLERTVPRWQLFIMLRAITHGGGSRAPCPVSKAL